MSEARIEQVVQDATNLAVSFTPVDKLPSPLLVIGLGGTGCDILRTVKRTFAQRFKLPKDAAGNTIPVPERTAYLAVDTDFSSDSGFDVGERVNITSTSIVNILNDHENRMSPEERTWVHKNLTSISPGAGAGTYRSAARLMLSRNFAAVKSAITTELKRIVSVDRDNSETLGRVEITIIAGIGGGTGSGTFLDMPQIVRYAMESDATLRNQLYKITGYLVMPDISLAHVKTDAMSGRIRANAYAALKELDFWMGYDTHRTHYTMTYGDGTRIDWVKPYDYCTLLSGTNVKGVAFQDSYQVAQNTVAENLLHYLAAETTVSGDAQFSYISYENNLDAMVATLPKNMPMNYLYRAVGAYAMAVPKKKLIYYEGSLLFKTFMPLRDSVGRLVPSDALLQDGKTPARVDSMMGNIGSLYNGFAGDNPYPAVFSTLDPKNSTQMDQLRTMQPVPHDYYRDVLQWDQTVLAPAARKSAADYLTWAWNNFREFCLFVLSDPKQGPYSLLLYLTNEGTMGFMPALRRVEQEWNNYAMNLHNDVAPRYDACCAMYNTFVHPPLLGGGKAVQNYLTSLMDLLNAVRLDCFMSAYNDAMTLFVKRVEEYVRTSLRVLCAEVEKLSDELVAVDATEDHQHGDLFNISIVKDTIDSTFEAQNQDDKVSRNFLDHLCRKSLETVENVDPHGCGVTFTFARDARDDIMVIMRDELNANLSNVNDQSLDAIMVQAGNTTIPQQNDYIDKLGTQVLNSASPLFSQNAGLPGQGQAEYSYFSIPNNSPLHVKRLRQTLENKSVEIKESNLSDHIYCTTAWDGLPLYRYSLLDSLEADYEAALQTDTSAGTHLVWNGDINAPYTSNWTKLPSPNPYYLFRPANGAPRARKEYEEARAIANRALNARLLTIDTSLEKPTYTFRAFYTDMTQRTLVHESIIQAQVNDLVTGVDPNTGAKRSGDALRKALDGLMNQAVQQKIAPQKDPAFMAGLLGIQDQVLNPFRPEVQANPQTLALAKRNFEALSREYAVVILLQQPELYARVCAQLAGFETIAAEIDKLDKMSNAWEPRVNFAATFAKMYSFGVLVQNMIGGFNFINNEDAQQAVMNPMMLSEELANQRLLVKTSSYLADLPTTNETITYLLARTNQREQNWLNEGTQGTLTKDEVTQRVNRLTKLLELVDSELKFYQNQKITNLNADSALLNNCIRLLRQMQAYAQNELTMLQM